MPRSPVGILVSLLIYATAMALMVWGLCVAQKRVIATLGSPEALAEWRAFAEETRKPPGPGEAVQRRPVKSDEPPSLVLMRDHFIAIAATSLLIGSFVYAFLAFLVLGSWRSKAGPADERPSG